jgi:hypothetical protein
MIKMDLLRSLDTLEDVNGIRKSLKSSRIKDVVLLISKMTSHTGMMMDVKLNVDLNKTFLLRTVTSILSIYVSKLLNLMIIVHILNQVLRYTLIHNIKLNLMIVFQLSSIMMVLRLHS